MSNSRTELLALYRAALAAVQGGGCVRRFLAARPLEGDVHAVAIGNRVETGTVFMNRCDYLDPALVWTGVKDTGKGAALSAIGYDNLTRPKSYHLREAI